VKALFLYCAETFCVAGDEKIFLGFLFGCDTSCRKGMIVLGAVNNNDIKSFLTNVDNSFNLKYEFLNVARERPIDIQFVA
jgi:hypothetical protein